MTTFDGIDIPESQEYPITGQDHNDLVVPDLAGIFNQKARSIKAEINCCQVGTVQAFYPATQTVDVTLNVLRIVENAVKQYPVLVQVPVFIPSGGDGRLTMPIAAGDQCLVLFCDRSIEAWATTGNVAAPSSERTHDLSDGVAIIGFFPASKSIGDYGTGGPELKHGDASLQIQNGVKALLKRGANIVKVGSNGISISNGTLSLAVEMAVMWAASILKNAQHIAVHTALDTLLAALAADTGLNATSRAAATAAKAATTTATPVFTAQNALEVTAKDNIGMIIRGDLA